LKKVDYGFFLSHAQQSAESEVLAEKVEGLKRDLNELNTLVDEALFFQKIETLESLVASAMETLVLAECCQEIATKAQPLAPEKHITLQIDETVRVQANAVYLRRLLQNLVINALRHCEQQIIVRYRDTVNAHVIEVEDDGEGIDASLREQLFQPFQRAENSRNKKLGGYGLGLAIVKRVAELHQGQVSIRDGELGGACFCFEWPKTH